MTRQFSGGLGAWLILLVSVLGCAKDEAPMKVSAPADAPGHSAASKEAKTAAAEQTPTSPEEKTSATPEEKTSPEPPAETAAKPQPLDHEVTEDDERITLSTPELDAAVRKRGYVSGIAAGSLVDKKTGFHDLGFGLDIVDWIMEPGSDEGYRDQLEGDLKYEFNNPYHGSHAKRSIEGPQICTKAKELEPVVIRGADFTAIKQSFHYRLAAPGKKTGSLWEQTIIFPQGKRYFISCDKITAVNDSPAMFLRIDMPGHIKHDNGDTFSEVYLSYHGKIKPEEFAENFAPDEKFLYSRGETEMPERFIRAYHIRDPETGEAGPWLAGMTLDPGVVCEAWCHQRSYVCMIEEFGGRPIEAGQSFSAVFVVGFFDSIEEMEQVYDTYRGVTELVCDENGWKFIK